MDNTTLTALITALLVIVVLAQVGVLIAQKRHARFELIEMYRKGCHDAQRVKKKGAGSNSFGKG